MRNVLPTVILTTFVPVEPSASRNPATTARLVTTDGMNRINHKKAQPLQTQFARPLSSIGFGSITALIVRIEVFIIGVNLFPGEARLHTHLLKSTRPEL